MRRALLAVALAASALAAAQPAAARWGPGAELVSSSLERHEQADDSTSYAAISGDGRYAVFQTRARNLFATNDPDPPGVYRDGGTFRRELAGGGLELVAAGDIRPLDSPSTLITRGAQNPSVSSDGRFVSFSTGERLAPADDNDNVDVYVRDMDLPPSAAGAYELVSARDGGDVPATYIGSKLSGAEVSRGTAISADGRVVVFRTTAASDLPDAAAPSIAGRAQILVRDRAAKSTRLVTVNSADGTAAGGAEGPAGVSADGTTVVWLGRSAQLQTRFLPGESQDDLRYYLWRRIADGASAVTRRITGMVDLDDPACPPGGSVTFDPSALGPCYGPLTAAEDANFDPFPDDPPALSGDGYRVAFLSQRPLRGTVLTSTNLDLFVTDMRPGVSRKAGTVELTREQNSDDPTIRSLALSADGSRIAFVTSRTQFILPSPSLGDTPAVGPDSAEVYVVDLRSMAISRATRAYDGGEVNGDAADGVSITSNGGRVAFCSTAPNLFFGDANGRPDAFVVSDSTLTVGGGAGGGGGEGGAAAAEEPPVAASDVVKGVRPRLRLSVKRAGGTAVQVIVKAPGAGTVDARALASQTERGRSRRAAARTLAQARRRLRSEGEATLLLRPAARYKHALRRRGRLSARLIVTFAPALAGPRLSVQRAVTFLQPRVRRAR